MRYQLLLVLYNPETTIYITTPAQLKTVGYCSFAKHICISDDGRKKAVKSFWVFKTWILRSFLNSCHMSVILSVLN